MIYVVRTDHPHRGFYIQAFATKREAKIFARRYDTKFGYVNICAYPTPKTNAQWIELFNDHQYAHTQKYFTAYIYSHNYKNCTTN